MIKLEKTDVYGWEAAIRGMRNPMNSWEKSDSWFDMNCDWIACDDCPTRGTSDCSKRLAIQKCKLGPNDHDLMMRLAKGGAVHAKYRRMITVTVDITAPLYWWKEFDTYKVGTVANSCSTMHKIHAKPFSVHDISIDTLCRGNLVDSEGNLSRPDLKAHYKHMMLVLDSLNNLRDLYLKTNDKTYWRCMIEMLPSSYNQKRTVMLNYEVLTAMYNDRKNHKLDEWLDFCKWIKDLPYSELIIGEEQNKKEI